jgi:hypothetical protein
MEPRRAAPLAAGGPDATIPSVLDRRGVTQQLRQSESRADGRHSGVATGWAAPVAHEEGHVNPDKLSQRWLLAAITYFVVGLALGTYMGASGDRLLLTVHSHLSLLGWASMGLTGLLYRSFPLAARSRLAVWHFWLYQLAVPVMLIAVAARYRGHPEAEPVAGASSTMILASGLLFWLAIVRARRGEPGTTPQ